ncbi:MAG TPA: hypothetical protein DHW71_04405 [Gammaproteobacteria bacterium]|nr:hypothetical protein [Gammaproteobacteria bacterium]MEC8010151.1 hypothetical protein [Pseudomonadota bacterium]HBF08347.1 hypothetical protein [Gammaproteobacteria bacterium]HCK92203.1 hypothetical protein [Gammaproteobacteria bacterium]
MYNSTISDAALKEKWGPWYYYFFPEKHTRASAIKEYQQNYQQWLKAWLKNTYKQLSLFLGNGFEILFDRYLRQFPLSTIDVNEFERDFLSIVKLNASLFYDVGTIDWLLSRIDLMDEEPVFPFKAFSLLSSDDFQKVTFQLSQAFFMIESDQPLDQIWSSFNANHIDEGLDVIFQAAPHHYGTAAPLGGGRLETSKSVFAVVRCYSTFEVVRLCSEEVVLARMLQEGATIDDIPIEAQAYLPSWIEKRRIVGFSI